MTLYKVFTDENRRITNIPGWANPDERKDGDTGAGFIVLDLTDDQVFKAIPNHSMLTADNVIVTDADYVPPKDFSGTVQIDPTVKTIAVLSEQVAMLMTQVANLTKLVVDSQKVGN